MYFFITEDTLAEWLRRRPAKPLGFARVGSNPTGVVIFCLRTKNSTYLFNIKTKKLLVGESNPGRPRDRRKCYQLHQPGCWLCGGKCFTLHFGAVKIWLIDFVEKNRHRNFMYF